MAKIDIEFLVPKPSRRDPQRWYWQPSATMKLAGWKQLALGRDATAAMTAAIARNREVETWRAGGPLADAPKLQRRVKSGTVAGLIRAFKSSDEWAALRATTRVQYASNLRSIDSWAGDQPLAAITRPRVQALKRAFTTVPVLGEDGRPELNDDGKPLLRISAGGHSILRVLRRLLQYALDEGLIFGANPAEKPGARTPPPRRQVWSETAIAAFVARADAMGRASVGTATLAGFMLGQRQADILKLNRGQMRNGAFRIRQGKTNVWVDVPPLPELAARLAALEAANRAAGATPLHIVISEETGRPYKPDDFRNWFKIVKDAAAASCPELAGLQYRDLRRTAVVRMGEAGIEVQEITAVSGHTIESTTKILETYMPRTSIMAGNGIRKWAAHREGQAAEEGKG